MCFIYNIMQDLLPDMNYLASNRADLGWNSTNSML